MHIGKGRGRQEGGGDDGDLVQVDQKGLRWREDGYNSVKDPLSSSIQGSPPSICKEFSFRAVRLSLVSTKLVFFHPPTQGSCELVKMIRID